VVAVKAGQCGEKKAGLFGCRFNATGKPTTCGSAEVKEESGEVEVKVRKQAQMSRLRSSRQNPLFS
jgi:hypothetical protein